MKLITIKVKVKQCLDRPIGFQEVEAQPLSPPRKYSWYSILLEAESNPGPYCGQKDYVNEKFQ
jgi:hypothetical protein